jgi:D-alanyl-D-alanine carboxypeptidase/D-alanyl-D-alanine-endopeptidase (penicillin-binding protein 4)
MPPPKLPLNWPPHFMSFLRSLILTLLLVCAAAPLHAENPFHEAAVASDDAALLQKSGFKPGEVGFVLVDLDDGRAVAANYADALFIPASVAKLATVYAAETLLGPDFRFETRLYRAGSTLYLQGGGDPVLTNVELRELAKQAKGQGGGITDFVFDATAVPERPEVDRGQPDQAVYNAGYGGLDLDFNRIEVDWTRGGGDKVTFTPHAIADGYNVKAEGIDFLPATSPSPPGAAFLYAGEAGVDKWLYAQGLVETLEETGATALPVKNPGMFAARTFRTIAQGQGLALPAPRPGAVPADATLVATVQSPPLPEIMKGLLKFSNNMTAELIGAAVSRKLTGAAQPGTGSAAAMADWLGKRLSYVDWRGFKLFNHSGLSTANRASPRQIAAILTAIARDPALAAMPNKTMGDDPGANAVAKTGTMDFASGLGGLLTAKSGRRFAFAIFMVDRDRRAKLDATFDSRILAPTPGARGWLGRARGLQQALLKSWRARY